MNLIEKLFRKKEKSLPEIKFDELTPWLERRAKKISQEVGEQAGTIYSNIENALVEIKKSTAMLENTKPEGRFHLKMVKIATSNRDNMVKQVGMLLNNIILPESTDIRTIMVFHENALQTLNVCLENMLKSYQYAKLVFLEDSKQVIADVNALGRLLNQLIEPINDHKKVLNAFEKAQSAIKTIKNTYSDIQMCKKGVNEKDENLLLLKKEIQENQRVIAQLKESEEWGHYLNYRNELAESENEAHQSESEIDSLVLPLKKALLRLKQLIESGRYHLTPDTREGLGLCLSDPKNVNPEFFVEFQKIIESGDLNLASEKQNKILEQLRLIASSFGSYKKQYQTLAQNIEKIKDEISKLNIIEEEKNLRTQLATLQDKLSLAEKELEASKKHLVLLENSLELEKQELQQCISIIDNRIRVSF